MRIRCRIGWHNWGQWGEMTTQNGKETRESGAIRDVVLLTQEVSCKDCCLVKRHAKTVKGWENVVD